MCGLFYARQRGTIMGVRARVSANSILITVGALALCSAACDSEDRYVDVNARDAAALLDGATADGSSASGGRGGNGGRDGSSGNTGGASGGRDGAVTNPFDGDIPEGASMDAAVLGLDAALELPPGTWILEDGAIVLPDGQVIDVDAAIDRYTPEIDVGRCEIGEEDTWSTSVDVFDEGGFALVPGQVGFGLAYRGGATGGCRQTLNAMPLSAAGGFGEPRMIDTECYVITDVSLVAADDGWRASWIDNSAGSAELQTLLLDPDMGLAVGATRRTLTTNDGKRERKPVMRDITGTPMVAWISEDVASRARSIETQLLDDDSAARTVLTEDTGQTPQSIALAQMGSSSAALAWVGPLDSPGVWLQPLDASGDASGDRIQLTDKVGASSSVDMATRTDGGAVIYSIEIDGIPQVRFRRLGANGHPVASERSIIGPPLSAQGASLAQLGGGYAVTYRALPGGNVTAPEIRLAFVTKEGNVMRDAGGQLISFRIGDATMAQGRTAVSVSVEGQIMIAWLDGDVSTGQNLLKVVRRRLDCQ